MYLRLPIASVFGAMALPSDDEHGRQPPLGEVWLLAGQSNMEGLGRLATAEAPDPRVWVYGLNECWAPAREPLHRVEGAVHPVYRELLAPRGDQGAGLGLPFAKQRADDTGNNIGLIAAAVGGTSLSQWDPALRDRGGASLYGAMLQRVRDSGATITGVLWYQGESDAEVGTAQHYRERFIQWVNALRHDLDNPRLPLLYAQLGRVLKGGKDHEPWQTVREAQRTAADAIPDSAMAATIDLPLDDPIHISTAGLKRLGRRLARLARRVCDGDESVSTGPRPVDVTLRNNTIHVRFAGVEGRLKPESHIGGFSIRDANGDAGPEVFDVSVDPDSFDTVVVRAVQAVPMGRSLWYGHGLDPYCNLTDDADSAAPAFGPWKL